MRIDLVVGADGRRRSGRRRRRRRRRRDGPPSRRPQASRASRAAAGIHAGRTAARSERVWISRGSMATQQDGRASQIPRIRLVRPRKTSFFFPLVRSIFSWHWGSRRASRGEGRRNASVEKQTEKKGEHAKERLGTQTACRSAASQWMDGWMGEKQKHVQIELRRISRASDAVCSIRKRALPCRLAALLRFCWLLPRRFLLAFCLPFARFCSLLRRLSVFGRRLAESTDPSVWPPAQPKLKSKTARAMALRYGRVARWTTSLEPQRQQQNLPSGCHYVTGRRIE